MISGRQGRGGVRSGRGVGERRGVREVGGRLAPLEGFLTPGKVGSAREGGSVVRRRRQRVASGRLGQCGLAAGSAPHACRGAPTVRLVLPWVLRRTRERRAALPRLSLSRCPRSIRDVRPVPLPSGDFSSELPISRLPKTEPACLQGSFEALRAAWSVRLCPARGPSLPPYYPLTPGPALPRPPTATAFWPPPPTPPPSWGD